MTTKKHIISSLPLGAVYYFVTRNAWFALVAAFSSIVIDVDHCLDYLITQKRIGALRNMIESFNTFEIVTKNYLLLHSWELVIIFGIFLIFYHSPFLIAIFTGYVFHLFLDQIFNTQFLGKYNSKDFFYFFFYRKIHNFDVLPLRKNESSINPKERIYA